MPTQYIEFEEVEVVTETDAAVLFVFDGEEQWVPKSAIEDNGLDFSDTDEPVTVYIAEWFCEKVGLW